MLLCSHSCSPFNMYHISSSLFYPILYVAVSSFLLISSLIIDHTSLSFSTFLSLCLLVFFLPVCEPEENVSRKIESGRGRKGELGENEDSESNCRCSEQTRLGMFTELLTLWKSQHAFTQVQGGPGRTHSHFSWNKNMYTEKTEHVGGIGLVSEGKSRDRAP